MGIKSITLFIITSILSINANGAIISTDWKASGDNLITYDTTSGLRWLDLTETNGISYNTITSQLGSGGAYEGFRYATQEEVVSLYAEFGIDLSLGGPNTITGAVDPAIINAVNFLGNIYTEQFTQYTYGIRGMVSDQRSLFTQYALGVSYNTLSNANQYDGEYYNFVSVTTEELYIGSYLIQQSAVPIPTAAWLFGSGLIGLIGVARRKKQD